MSTEITESPIKIKMPEMRLKIADLAYLRALANPNGKTPCYDANARDRLLFLGLIERKQISPTAEVKAQANSKLREIRKELSAMARRDEWDKISALSYDAKRAIGSLTPTIEMVPTKAGLQLLKQGETLSNVKGCAPKGLR